MHNSCMYAVYNNVTYMQMLYRYRLLDEYPSEPYTDVFWIKFVDINAARIAKKKLDNNSFFGKNIHVCYAPEFESVKDTRDKLQQRRRTIASKTKGNMITGTLQMYYNSQGVLLSIVFLL